MSTTPLTRWTDYKFAHLNNARVLVTGGAGFIGSHLSIALASLGADVIVLDDLSGGGDATALPAEVTFAHGSILDIELLQRLTVGCQFVFHQAALGSVPRSVEQPRLYQDVNVNGTLNVLECARAAGVRRVMFAASSSAYGDSPELPKVETMPTAARSPYAANKVAAESLLSAYSASYGLDTVSLRYFNIFGPRQNPESVYAAVIAAFAKALLAGKHPVIFGDGEQSRDFTYVDNAVLANLLATVPVKPLEGAVVNVACGRRVTVSELAKDMAGLIGRPDLTPIYMEDRAGDVKHSLANLDKAEALLGYHPAVDFKRGLEQTVLAYSQSLQA